MKIDYILPTGLAVQEMVYAVGRNSFSELMLEGG